MHARDNYQMLLTASSLPCTVPENAVTVGNSLHKAAVDVAVKIITIFDCIGESAMYSQWSHAWIYVCMWICADVPQNELR
jgi:hypothetical protein